jgi:hypothetical protein
MQVRILPKAQIMKTTKATQKRKRKVCTIYNGKSQNFSSLKEASEKTNVALSHICQSCKYGIKVKGLKFSYV